MDANKLVRAHQVCGGEPDCTPCPYFIKNGGIKDGCTSQLMQDTGDFITAATARIAELEVENERLAIPFAENNLMDLVRVNHDVYNSLKHREAEIAELEAEVKALKAQEGDTL